MNKFSRESLVSSCDGKVTAYALKDLEKLGTMFVKPGMEVLKSQVVGISKNDMEIEINVTKEKRVTNVRTVFQDENIKLNPIKELTMEDCINFVNDDEKIDICGGDIRILKTESEKSLRQKLKKDNKESCFI